MASHTILIRKGSGLIVLLLFCYLLLLINHSGYPHSESNPCQSEANTMREARKTLKNAKEKYEYWRGKGFAGRGVARRWKSKVKSAQKAFDDAFDAWAECDAENDPG